jgi:peptide/nickel transport system permease protein
VQYLYWVRDFLVGDLGNSLYTGKSVAKELLNRLPLTLQLALMAEALSLAIGIPVGILSAVRQDQWLDRLLRFWSIFFLAVPTFWLGLLVLLIGAIAYQWIPPLGYNLLWENPGKNLAQLIWPVLILASHESARVSRMTRSSMLEVLREDYIRTARAKGLSERLVLVRHALKNALIPIVTYTSVYFGTLLGGVVVLEQIFNIPGLGSLFIDSIQFRDYTAIQALVFLLATGFIAINLVVDILYGWLDPRISLEKPGPSG